MDSFKRITASDLALLEKHYLAFEPYSDFNVVSIWGYMVPDAYYIHTHGSVLYKLLDYNTGEPYLSVFGNKSSRKLVADVAKTIETPTFTLYGVPESTRDAAFADWSVVTSIEEDIDNHDYIFSVSDIARFDDDKYKEKKKKLTKFARLYPNVTVKKIDHNQPEVREKMYDVFKKWIRESGSTTWQREYRGLQRTLGIKGFRVMCVAAFDDQQMIGFTVNEIENNDYYQGHYGKAGYKYHGLGLLLEHETAKIIMRDYGSKYMNLQQDLGIEGIRYYKQSLRPLKQLKKYNIVIDTKLAAND
jgi:hypothetical protein